MRDNPRTRLVLVLLLLTAFTLITLDARGGQGSLIDRLRTSAQGVLGPVEEAAAAIVRPFADFVDGVSSIGENQERIDALEQENEALLRQLRTQELDSDRLDQLERLFGLAGAGQYRMVPAQVIGVSHATGFLRTVSIDAGTRDGIRVDQTVMNGDGLVGRVTEVGPGTATVLLVIDPTFAAGVRMVGTQEIGSIRGAGALPLDLTLFNPQAPLVRGDVLVTLGSVFVPGVPVGEVLNVRSTPGALTRSANVAPFVDFTSLDLVGVIVEQPRRDPRDALVPTPSPTPTPTPAPSVTSTPTP